MEFSEVVHAIADGDNMMWIVGGTIAVVAIVFSNVAGVFRTQAREKTRREIAAYIAEGSMTPEQGERLLKAGREGQCR
jgi:chromate transport protein ChrA